MAEHFYDGQIRKYLVQMMRLLSNFSYKTGDGTTVQVPVMYGDMTRQVSSILRDNSENKIPSAPRMAVYITGLEMDRDRTSDSSYVNKRHVRERLRDTNTGEYTDEQGRQYTVERLMPTPYRLTMNCDIWATNTDMKLQIMEQILMLFNPSLDIQTTDNYLDWTSLTTVMLDSVNFSSRSIPVGVDSEIDVAQLTFSTPIYISPPAKVKRLGVVTNIVTSIFDGDGYYDFEKMLEGTNLFSIGGATAPYEDGAEQNQVVDTGAFPNKDYEDLRLAEKWMPGIVYSKDSFASYDNIVYIAQENHTSSTLSDLTNTELWAETNIPAATTWDINIDYSADDIVYHDEKYYKSSINHTSSSDNEPGVLPGDAPDGIVIWVEVGNGIKSPRKQITRTVKPIVKNPLQERILVLNGEAQLLNNGLPSNTQWPDYFRELGDKYQPGLSIIYLRKPDISGLVAGRITVNSLDETKLVIDWDRDTLPSNDTIEGPARNTNQYSSVDYIIDPLRYDPQSDTSKAGVRLLLLGAIGNADNSDGADAWKNTDNSDFVAGANDIIEYDGTNWHVVFDASQDYLPFNDETVETLYTTNLNTGVQYYWDGEQWLLSVDGEYAKGDWVLRLDG